LRNTKKHSGFAGGGEVQIGGQNKEDARRRPLGLGVLIE
jgi:hypothetical protein